MARLVNKPIRIKTRGIRDIAGTTKLNELEVVTGVARRLQRKIRILTILLTVSAILHAIIGYIIVFGA